MRRAGHFHAVRFYENSQSLCRIIAEFLGEGITQQNPAVIIATPEHRDGILEALRSRHVDVEKIQSESALLVLDARETLSKFMDGDIPDPELFTRAITPEIDRLNGNREGATIRAYGEMVDVLWKEGRTAAAVRLEMLWNQLAMTRDFSLLCGYAMGSFYKDAGRADICAQHTHVMDEEMVGII